jgi:hypothetical protein
VMGSKTLLPLLSHGIETRRTKGNVTGTVMAVSKLSMVITPLQSMPQAKPKILLQDIAHYNINVIDCGTLLGVTQALDI